MDCSGSDWHRFRRPKGALPMTRRRPVVDIIVYCTAPKTPDQLGSPLSLLAPVLMRGVTFEKKEPGYALHSLLEN